MAKRNRIADELNNANLQTSASASVAVVDRLQDYRAGEQVMAATAVFLLLCDHYGVPAQDAFTATKNAMNDADRRLVPEFRGVKAYIENELK